MGCPLIVTYVADPAEGYPMKAAPIFLLIALTACAHTDIYTSDIKAEGPKIVALQAPRVAWVMQIEGRLHSAGFEVRRFESTQTVSEADGPSRVATYREAAAPYLLRLEGAANLSAMGRCFGGGFNFDHISAELIDVRSNQTIGSYSGQGYSEGCAPMSGKIFTNITSLVQGAWSK